MKKRKNLINVICIIFATVLFGISCSMNYFIDDIIINVICRGVFIILGVSFLFFPNVIFKKTDETKQVWLTRVFIWSLGLVELLLFGIIYIVVY